MECLFLCQDTKWKQNFLLFFSFLPFPLLRIHEFAEDIYSIALESRKKSSAESQTSCGRGNKRCKIDKRAFPTLRQRVFETCLLSVLNVPILAHPSVFLQLCKTFFLNLYFKFISVPNSFGCYLNSFFKINVSGNCGTFTQTAALDHSRAPPLLWRHLTSLRLLPPLSSPVLTVHRLFRALAISFHERKFGPRRCVIGKTIWGREGVSFKPVLCKCGWWIMPRSKPALAAQWGRLSCIPLGQLWPVSPPPPATQSCNWESCKERLSCHSRGNYAGTGPAIQPLSV